MKPTDNLSHGGDYGYPAGTFDQLEQEEDLMLMLSDPPPPSPSLWLPPAEGLAGPENFEDMQSSPMDEDEVPCVPAAVDEETNYAAARAAPLVATHGTEPDELPHPQQQLPLPTNDPDPTILPSQPPSITPVINPCPDEANHAASVPMGSQGTLISAAPHNQEADIPSRASTRRRSIKRRGLPSQPQDRSSELFGMVIDMIRQFGRHIGKMMKDEENRSIVWQHFRRSHCKNCSIVTMICQYCNTVMICPSTTELLKHLESCYNYILLLPASSRASKETQRSSQTLQIKEIAENPNGENEPIETDNSNCATTAVRLGTQGTNAVVVSPRQPFAELEDLISWSLPCCDCPQVPGQLWSMDVDLCGDLVVPDSWRDLIIRLCDSSCCSSTTKSSHDGFRLKFSNNEETGYERVHVSSVHSSAAWVRVSNNWQYRVVLGPGPDTVGSSNLRIGSNVFDFYKGTALGCTLPWLFMLVVLCNLGFREEFARDAVIYALGWVDACNLWLRSPSSSNNGRIIVEQGDASSLGKRKRKPLAPRSKVWNHFTKEVVEAEGGSMVTMAKCKHCLSELRADSASHGTNQLKRHIRSRHPEHAESL